MGNGRHIPIIFLLYSLRFPIWGSKGLRSGVLTSGFGFRIQAKNGFRNGFETLSRDSFLGLKTLKVDEFLKL